MVELSKKAFNTDKINQKGFFIRNSSPIGQLKTGKKRIKSLKNRFLSVVLEDAAFFRDSYLSNFLKFMLKYLVI